ncbi:hypothetical protein DL770_011685 [Monosporascus sp. CRB-9-2]|nr:hypothetical protein DL770_011685 [Monosporascus sp. CRB-9-2]
MAQGAIKKSSSGAGGMTARANKPQQQKQKTKKGARVAKPRKASAADKLQRKYAAGLTAKTEKLLGERAGHLELIGAGRKGKKDGGGGGGEKGGSKGGSRKFG